MSLESATTAIDPTAAFAAQTSAKDGLLVPDVSDSIAQFLPTEVSSSESEDEEEAGSAAGGSARPPTASDPHPEPCGAPESESEFLEELDDISDGEGAGAASKEKDSAPGAGAGAASGIASAHVAPRSGIAASEAAPKFRGRPSSCVFVASLAASLSDDDLCLSVTENFKKFGRLTMVKVLRDPANRPYAFVQYTNDADAKKALKEAQGSSLNGRTIRCEPARVNRTLFVCYKGRNLNSSGLVSAAFVNQLLEKFGELEQLVACRDQFFHRKNNAYSGSDRSNAWFIQFAYRDDAIRAFANLKSDLNWVVEWAQNIEAPSHMNMLSDSKNLVIREETEPENEGACIMPVDSYSESSGSEVVIDQKSIFVGQLDPMATEEGVLERFSRHGSILELNLISKPNNVFAFIRFTTEEAAAAALEMENHAMFLNKTMHVQYREIGGIKKFRRGNYNHRNNNNGVHGNHNASGSGNGSRHESTSNSQAYNQATYQPPRLNLAPPPINVGKRRSSTGSGNYNHHYQHYPFGHEFQVYAHQPHQLSMMGGPKKSKASLRHRNVEITKSIDESNNDSTNTSSNNNNNDTDNLNGGASEKSKGLPNELKSAASQSFVTDVTSDTSGSAGNNDASTNASTSRYTYSAGGINYKKKLDEYKKRGNYPTFDPYYYPPYYYPVEFPLNPMGPSGLAGRAGPGAPLSASGSPAHPGNQPYFMYYPLPQGSGMEFADMHNMMVPHLGGSPGPMGSPIFPLPISQQHFIPSDRSVSFNGEEKAALEY
ncbi:RIM4-like protein [Lachancea thermotolerans]